MARDILLSWQRLLAHDSRNFSATARTILRCETLEERVAPDANSAGPNGINATATGLLGNDIHIGQIETFRPGKAPKDGPDYRHDDVVPTEVYLRNEEAFADKNVGNHAISVAGVMIANGNNVDKKGISRNAKLHSSALDDSPAEPEVIFSMQYVASQNGGVIPAINASFGRALVEGEQANGGSQTSLALDYLARRYWDGKGTLFVIAKADLSPTSANELIPADTFNGLVVAEVDKIGDVFRRVSNKIDFTKAQGNRYLIQIVAPGGDILVPEQNAQGGDIYQKRSGTSLATPHATSTVALLQQYAAANNLPADAKRHEVMKVVILNSAEKLKGLLGMTRDVLKTDNTTWAQSTARDDDTNQGGRALPLDEQMGTGFLNTSRALEQLQSGKYDPNDIKAKRWDYGSITRAADNDPPTFQKYNLGRLKGGSWISATLTWDRPVKLTDKDGNDKTTYTVFSDKFVDQGLANLELYLMPKGETDFETKNIWSSVSPNQNIEHIFYHLKEGDPTTGDKEYELWVRQRTKTTTNYAVAWWGEPGKVGVGSIGDKVWKDTLVNGLQDSGEPGIENVPVSLYTAAGGFVDSTTTDNHGNYLFYYDTPGAYYVEFTPLYGYGFTEKDAGFNANDTIDSDADLTTGRSHTFFVSATGDLTIDAGLKDLPYGSIGDFVWQDNNGNGLQDFGEPGMPNVEVTLFKSNGDYFSGTVTDSTGHYQFTNVAPGDYYVEFTAPDNYEFSPKDVGSNDAVDSDADPATGITATFTLALGQVKTDVDAGLVLAGGTIGDYVWFDVNGDGIQDAGESGIGGVAVTLYDSNDNFVAETATDGDGYYSFTTIHPGDYYLIFDAPPDYVFSPVHAGSDPARDNDADATGQTADFHLSLGQVNLTLDAGMRDSAFAVIGDRVWHDMNHNGIQNAGEPGIGGITVQLLDANNNVVDTTYSGANGLYSFIFVPPGTYKVKFSAAGTPTPLVFTTPNVGDDALDSDADPGTGITGTYTVTAGQINLTVDAGLLFDPFANPIPITNTVPPPPIPVPVPVFQIGSIPGGGNIIGIVLPVSVLNQNIQLPGGVILPPPPPGSGGGNVIVLLQMTIGELQAQLQGSPWQLQILGNVFGNAPPGASQWNQLLLDLSYTYNVLIDPDEPILFGTFVG